MNPIERVRAALHFTGPDRVPVMNFMSAFNLLFFTDVHPMAPVPPKSWQPGWSDDEVGLFPQYSDDLPGFRWKVPEWAKDPKYKDWRHIPHEEIDEWGCIWYQTDRRISVGHPGRPSLPDWSNLDEYIDRYFLDPEDKSRYRLTMAANKIFSFRKYRMIVIGTGPFNIAANMRGFTTFLSDHRRNPERVKYLLGQITDNLVKQIKMFIKLGGKPHGVFMYEDLASQTQPFMNPLQFKEFYEPHYRALIDAIHDYGGEFHHHCCGKIDRLIPLFIEWGHDALELDSPRMTGYPDLRPFRGKIMFWGCVDIQKIYVKPNPKAVEQEVWHMVRNLGTPDGGFGAYFYPQYYHIKAPKANISAFRRGLKKYGKYSKIPASWWSTPPPEEWDFDEVPPLPLD